MHILSSSKLFDTVHASEESIEDFESVIALYVCMCNIQQT